MISFKEAAHQNNGLEAGRWGGGAVGCTGYIIAKCTKAKCSWEDMGLEKIVL